MPRQEAADRHVRMHEVRLLAPEQPTRPGTPANAPAATCARSTAPRRRGTLRRAAHPGTVPSAQAPTTSWPRARISRISGNRKCRSEKSTLVISRFSCKGGTGCHAPTLVIAHFTAAGPPSRPVSTTCSVFRNSPGAQIDAFLQRQLRPVGAQQPAAARAAGASAPPRRPAAGWHGRSGAGGSAHVGLRLIAASTTSSPRISSPLSDSRGGGGGWRRTVCGSRRGSPPASARRSPPGAAPRHARGPPAQPFGLQLARNWCRRSPAWNAPPSRGAASRHSGPAAGAAPTVDDHAVAPDRQFETQRAGMGEAVEPGRRRRAAIDDQHRPPGLQPLEPAVGQRRRRRGCRGRPGSAPDRPACRSPPWLPLNSASPPSPCRSARSAGAMRSMALAERRRRLRLGGLQQRADFGQVLQRRHQLRRAALDVAAVRQHLAREFLRQARAAPGSGKPRGRAAPPRPRSGPSARSARGRRVPRRQRRGEAARVGHQPAPSASGESRHRRWRRRNHNGRARRRCARPATSGRRRNGIRAAGPAIQSAPGRAPQSAPSVPSARRSRSQVKPCA